MEPKAIDGTKSVFYLFILYTFLVKDTDVFCLLSLSGSTKCIIRAPLRHLPARAEVPSSRPPRARTGPGEANRNGPPSKLHFEIITAYVN